MYFRLKKRGSISVLKIETSKENSDKVVCILRNDGFEAKEISEARAKLLIRDLELKESKV